MHHLVMTIQCAIRAPETLLVHGKKRCTAVQRVAPHARGVGRQAAVLLAGLALALADRQVALALATDGIRSSSERNG